jgi:DNA-binding NarL/FixJ family response regulator
MSELIQILIADDHTLFRDGLRALFRSLPDTAVIGEAATGAEAIAQAEKVQPDVILMDIQMPEMDGLEAIRRIREREQAEGRGPVPILAMTGHGTEIYRHKCQSAGADACLFKPFRFEELRDAISAIAASSR